MIWPTIDSGTLANVATFLAFVWSALKNLSQNKQLKELRSASNTAQVAEYQADATSSSAAQAQIQQLMDRVERNEKRIKDVEDQYIDVQKRLTTEQLRSARLQIRIEQLETILRQHNIAVPPSDGNTESDS